MTCLNWPAYCSHQAACHALGDEAPCISESGSSWAYELRCSGEEACLRSAIASAVLVLEHFEQDYPDDPRFRQALQAAIAWIACPCEMHGQVATDAAEAVSRFSGDLAKVASNIAWAVANAPVSIDDAAYASSFAANIAKSFGKSKESVRQTICDSLIPWALGYGDPILEPDFLPPHPTEGTE